MSAIMVDYDTLRQKKYFNLLQLKRNYIGVDISDEYII